MPPEHPVLFGDALVRAILDGRKTQTRRLVRQPASAGSFGFNEAMTKAAREGWAGVTKRGPEDGVEWSTRCPLGVPGDHLWVREAWNLGRVMRDCEGIADDVMYWSGPLPKSDPGGARLIDDWAVSFRADGDPDGRYRPSIHMPRWASRLTLRVTSVRVERLQAISEEDAAAEGVGTGPCDLTAREIFMNLWQRIYGCSSWDANPWVWVVGFERVEVSRG